MAKRKHITKKTRFEVFKRDSFTCQYCGRNAPSVLLQIDHIVPVSKGGEDEILNLITSCADCNSGKSDRHISDDAVVKKRHLQATKVQERREQIEMMMHWHTAQKSLDELELEKIESILIVNKHQLNHGEKNSLRKLIKKFGFSIVVEACQIAVDTYVVDGAESFEYMLSKIPGICACKRDPTLNEAVHIRNIIRKRYWVPVNAIALIKDFFEEGLSYEEGKRLAGACRGWSDFEAKVYEEYDRRAAFGDIVYEQYKRGSVSL